MKCSIIASTRMSCHNSNQILMSGSLKSNRTDLKHRVQIPPKSLIVCISSCSNKNKRNCKLWGNKELSSNLWWQVWLQGKSHSGFSSNTRRNMIKDFIYRFNLIQLKQRFKQWIRQEGIKNRSLIEVWYIVNRKSLNQLDRPNWRIWIIRARRMETS